MQVYQARTTVVQRDMDLVRSLLLRIESDRSLNGTQLFQYTTDELGLASYPADEVSYNLGLLIDEGFVDGVNYDKAQLMPVIKKLTWEGHELLDNIRDDGIWEKVKDRIKGIPTVAISVVSEIAKAEIRKRLGLP